MVKAAVFIFPFIKELFLGKDKDKKDGTVKDPKALPPEKGSKGHILRQVLIAAGVLSVIVNFALIEKIFTMASSMVSLKREVATARLESQVPKIRPSDDAHQLTPQGMEAQTKPGELPPSPTPVPDRQPVVIPPREEHLQPPARQSHGSSGRRSDSSVVDRSDSSHRRLRSIDDIK